MRKTNKLIALICSLAMILSMFANITLVSAAGAGVELSVDTAASTDTVKVINAKYVGMDAGLASFTLDLTLPEGATAATTSKMFTSMSDGMYADKGFYRVAGMSATNVKADDGIMATITITLAAPLTEDFTATLIGDSYIADENGDGVFVADGSMAAASVVLAAPVATEAPATPIPTCAPVEKGIELALDASSTDTVKVINAIYKGMDAGIASFTIDLTIPEGATAATTSKMFTSMSDGMYADKGFYRVAGMSATNVTAEDGVMATITVTLASALTDDFVATLIGDSYIADENGDGVFVADASMPAAYVVLTAPAAVATDAPTEAPATEVPKATPIPTAEPVEKGIQLVLDEASSTDTVKVINALYKGMDAGIASFTIDLTIPEGATAATTSKMFTSMSDGMYAEQGFYRVAGMSATNVTAEDGVMATITVTLAEPLANDFVATLIGDSYIADENGDGVFVADGSMPSTYVVLTAPVVEATEAPATATPDATATDAPEVTAAPTANPRPTPIVEATAAPTDAPSTSPDVTPIPTAEPVEKGIQLVLDEASSTDTVKVINALYKGMDAGIASFTIDLTIPEGATAATTSKMFTSMSDGMYAEQGFYRVAGMSATNVTAEDGVMATITVTLAEALTNDFVATLIGDSYIADENGDGVFVADGSMPSTYVVLTAPVVETTPEPPVEPTETPEPTEEPAVVVEVPLSDLVDASKASTEVGTLENPSTSYVTIVTDGVYGTDYVAKDADGNVLTEAEFINKISGYDGSVADAINNITLVIYTEGTEITANLNDATTNTIVDSGTTTGTAATPEPTDKPDDKDEPSIKWSVDSISMNKNRTKTAKIVLNNIDMDDVDDIDYDLSNDEVVEITVDDDDERKISIESGNKTGKVTITATVTVGDEKYTADLKVTVKASTGGGGGTGSNSVGTIAGGTVGSDGLWLDDQVRDVYFTDLDQAAWAADAITYLASRGVINGRTATTFVPNADITRAEFAKLVMTTYGITVPSGVYTTSSYSDIAAGAWYFDCIEAASMLGIVTGYPDGTFRPDALVSRQEMALMMYRATKVRNTVLPTVNAATAWADADQIGDWAAEAVTALNVAGVMNGTSATTFEPTAAATRAQAAQMIYNLYQVAQ